MGEIIKNKYKWKMFAGYKNMYNNIKSCVKVNSSFSTFFPCSIGVRQGENLSPLLFSLFLNDLESFFRQNSNVQGITIDYERNTNDFFNLLKIFILLYADDTVIIAESANDLQVALNTRTIL